MSNIELIRILDQRIDNLSESLLKSIQVGTDGIGVLGQRIDLVIKRLDTVDQRLDRVEADVATVRVRVEQIAQHLHVDDERDNLDIVARRHA